MSPTGVTEEIYRAACRIFDELWDKSTPIRQLGVGISKLQIEAAHQYNLFDLGKHDRLEKLNQTPRSTEKRMEYEQQRLAF